MRLPLIMLGCRLCKLCVQTVLHLSASPEKVRSLKVAADGSRPLDRAFENILEDTHVSFHLLPLAIPEKPKFVPQPPLKRKTEETGGLDDKADKPTKKGKGNGKGKKGGTRVACA